MRLTRKQLQNDLDAAKKREEMLRVENERYAQQSAVSVATIRKLVEERDDWRFAFRTICKAVNR